MSRSYDGEGESIPEGLWEGQLRSTLKSKKSQRFLKRMEHVLLRMKANGNGRLADEVLVEAETDHAACLADVNKMQAEGKILDWSTRSRLEKQHTTIHRDNVCALGAMALHDKHLDPEWVAQHNSESLMDSAGFAAEHLDISYRLAWEIADINDSPPGHYVETKVTDTYTKRDWVVDPETPEQRFERVLKWVQSNIIREEVAA